jgi:hypothetical protein
MKKLKLHSILILTAILLCSIHENSFSQGFAPGKGFAQVDFGVGASTWGIPIYAGLDFGVSDAITIGPRVSYRSHDNRYLGRNYGYSIFNLGFRGDYHYSYHIDALPDELDLYGGLSLGYSIWNDKDGDIDPDADSRVIVYAQAGARWYFTDSWAANAEVSGGNFSGLEVGLSYRFK